MYLRTGCGSALMCSGSLQALKNLISEIDLILHHRSPLGEPHRRLPCNLRAALALTEDPTGDVQWSVPRSRSDPFKEHFVQNCHVRTRLTRAYMRAATAYEAASRRVMEIGSDLEVTGGTIDAAWADAHQMGHRALAARRALADHIKHHGCDVLLADE